MLVISVSVGSAWAAKESETSTRPHLKQMRAPSEQSSMTGWLLRLECVAAEVSSDQVLPHWRQRREPLSRAQLFFFNADEHLENETCFVEWAHRDGSFLLLLETDDATGSSEIEEE